MSFASSTSRYQQPHKWDLPVVIAISIGMLVALSIADIVLHDYFVRRLLDFCNQYPSDSKCADLNNSVNINTGIAEVQIKVGDGYWVILNMLIVIFSIIPAFFRWAVGRAHIAGLLYFISILLPLLGGFEDVLYFAFKHQGVPEQMPWLNNNVYIGSVNAIVNHGAPVTSSVFYLSMASVLGILTLAWGLALYKRK